MKNGMIVYSLIILLPRPLSPIILAPMIPTLLNDDGSASMATLLLMSHHAFRRDLTRYLKAVEQLKTGDISHADALREEWTYYRGGLHGHHQMEDSTIFPDIKSKHPELATALDKLTSDHHHIDPLLERGDAAFAALPDTALAETVLKELKALLDAHLTFEEAEITPSLRESKDFPVVSDEHAPMYAQGFSWSMSGIAPEVNEQVKKMLPENLLSRLPKAQAAFNARCERVWGSVNTGASTTPIPEGY